MQTRYQLVKEKLYQFFLESDQKRKEALNNRMVEIQEALKDMLIRQKEVMQNENFPIQNYLSRGSELANNIVNRYEELTTKIQARLNAMHTVLEHLDIKGINPMVLTTVKQIGYLCAIISGWFFFSFYSKTTGADPEKSNSIYNGVLTFFRTAGPLAAVGSIAAFLVITTALSAATEWFKWNFLKQRDDKFRSIIKARSEDSDSKYTLQGELSQLDSLPLKVNISSNTWFEFWMEMMPAIFIGLMVLLAASFGVAEHKNSTAAPIGSPSVFLQLVGFIMAVGAGAAFNFFMVVKGNKILTTAEPENKNPETSTWFKRNNDLVLLIVFLTGVDALALLAAVAVRLAGDTNIPSQLFQQLMALAEFIVFMNVAGLCIGFTAYCKGLFNNIGWLEYKLDTTHAKLRFFFHQSLSIFFTHDFGKKYKNLFEDLLNLLELRLTAGRNFNEKKDKKKDTTSNNTPPVTNAVGDKELWQLPDDDKLYFPELVAEFTSYNTERLDLKKTIEALENEASAIYTQIDNWNYRIRVANDYLPQQIRVYQDWGYKERVFIKEGFDLGIWYRENEVGPRNDYYEKYNHAPNGNDKQ